MYYVRQLLSIDDAILKAFDSQGLDAAPLNQFRLRSTLILSAKQSPLLASTAYVGPLLDAGENKTAFIRGRPL